MLRSHAPSRRGRLLGVMLVIALAACLPGVASASVKGSDTIGGIEVASQARLGAVAPDISVPAGILETSDGEVLWGRATDEQRAMASTTKIMTAIVVLESGLDLNEKVTVPASATTVGEAGVGLRTGQSLTVRQLLEAMLVHSGNDAAITLAVRVSGSQDAFAEAMNAKAAQLDVRHSHFTNPHGLDEFGHYTSAADLATLARYAMQNEVFRTMVTKTKVRVPTASGGIKEFDASNKLLGIYDGATGVKTGWTNDAGYCLVASATRGDVSLVAVVLGAGNEDERFDQARHLLDWGFEHYRVTNVASAEQTAALVPVTDYLDTTVPAVLAGDLSVPLFDVEGEPVASVQAVTGVEAPVAKGQRLGTLSVVQGERLIAQVPIVAARDVEAPGLWKGFTIGVTRVWRRVFGGRLQAAPATVLHAM